MDSRNWLDLLSECTHVVGLLEESGHRAVARVGEGERLEWDAYPASSMPEGSIARGRVSDPTALAVIRHAGGLDPDDEKDRDKLAEKGVELIPDRWRDRYDPVGGAVNRMLAETRDAANRLATAQVAAHDVRRCGGEVYGVIELREQLTWPVTLGRVREGIKALHQIARDLREVMIETGEQKAAQNRLERELFDAKNRLRTAERSMREATPTTVPERAREVCKSCGTARDVATDFGAHPQYWVVSEASCRECLRRPARVAQAAAKRKAS